MDQDLVVRLHSSFEAMVQTHPDAGTEFWLARDLQFLLGYAQWRAFEAVIERAMESCKTAGFEPRDHFARARKMVDVGSGARREVDDYALTRYACYLIAQNGDPSKEPIAFAQTYFAVQTRKQELIAQRLAEAERISARRKLSRSEKELSGIIFERLHDEKSFARIKSKGDQALFGGMTTRDMKKKLGTPESRPLADFLPTITIKAKDFANEITNFNVKERGLRTESGITGEHTQNNHEVRRLLHDRGIVPEKLPPAEDVKKVERRLATEQKKESLAANADSTSSRPIRAIDHRPPRPRRQTPSTEDSLQTTMIVRFLRATAIPLRSFRVMHQSPLDPPQRACKVPPHERVSPGNRHMLSLNSHPSTPRPLPRVTTPDGSLATAQTHPPLRSSLCLCVPVVKKSDQIPRQSAHKRAKPRRLSLTQPPPHPPIALFAHNHAPRNTPRHKPHAGCPAPADVPPRSPPMPFFYDSVALRALCGECLFLLDPYSPVSPSASSASLR